MAAPTIAGLAARVAALETRVAALQAQVADNAGRIADLNVSDEASGWKQWRENRGNT